VFIISSSDVQLNLVFNLGFKEKGKVSIQQV